MTNRELLNKLKELESKNPEILDDEVVTLFMESDYETSIREASIRKEILNDDYEFVSIDRPQFIIVVDC